MSANASMLEGGKGNAGLFVNRVPCIISAGEPSKQANERLEDYLQHYLLKDEVDSLINDTIFPKPPPLTKDKLPPLRRPRPKDTRHIFPTNVKSLIQPTPMTRFQGAVEEIKNTIYSSYWNKPLAMPNDPMRNLPNNLDYKNTTFGRKIVRSEGLYEVIFPKDPVLEDPVHRRPGLQREYNYCSPPVDRSLVFGRKNKFDVKGAPNIKDCLTDNSIKTGNSKNVQLATTQATYKITSQSQTGQVLAPIENIYSVPENHSFGVKTIKTPEDCVTGTFYYKINPKKKYYEECIAYLNSLRRMLRKHPLTFFRQLYRELKHFDKDHIGWLPKEIVYKHFGTRSIRVDPKVIEPLLELWNAIDGSCIEYKKLVDLINDQIPLPEMPKIEDYTKECLHYNTTYSEMVKPGQCADPRPMAGLPSGRYFDLDYLISPDDCCRAYQTCLLQESDVRSCISPSTMTRFFVSHRDMYAKRDPEVVRKVFEATGESFTDEEFDQLWQEAQKYHSKGWVCFETFRKVLNDKNKN